MAYHRQQGVDTAIIRIFNEKKRGEREGARAKSRREGGER